MTEVCQSCGSNENTETHHITYVPEKTVTLCHSCHKSVHSNPDSEFHPKQKLGSIEGLERTNAPERATPTVKEINQNKYVYWQWREGDKVKSEYVGGLDALMENITSWTRGNSP